MVLLTHDCKSNMSIDLLWDVKCFIMSNAEELNSFAFLANGNANNIIQSAAEIGRRYLVCLSVVLFIAVASS